MRSVFQTLSKYGLTSLSATAVDFGAFHLALTWLLVPAVHATVLGRCMGTVVAFWMQRRWVFRHTHATNWWALCVKYGSGVVLGMALNVSGVWLLHDLSGWTPWPARIASALLGWYLMFLFNRHVVFRPAINRPTLNDRM